MLKLIEKLLKEGRGFNLQSHGTNAAGDEFFNFALYPAPGDKGSTYYVHGHDENEVAETVLGIINDETPVLNVEVLKKAKASIPLFSPAPTLIPSMPMPTPRG